MKKIRCAIYTRKSAEEGLEQEFNSLDAQREACAAYVARPQGGGLGAAANCLRGRGALGRNPGAPGPAALARRHRCRSRRPDCGLQGRPTDPFPLRLCEARRPARRGQHRVCLGDPVLQHRDQHGTTDAAYACCPSHNSSREVTAERIRDKIAASKRKGLWMGGRVPLGYEKDERTLRINEAEAETVRTLYALYRKHGTLRQVKAEADRLRLRTKQRFAADGARTGGLPFRRGHLHCLLTNPLYAGRIRHQRRVYEGQHPSIIAPELWDAVQAQLQAGAAQTKETHDEGPCSPLPTGRQALRRDRRPADAEPHQKEKTGNGSATTSPGASSSTVAKRTSPAGGCPPRCWNRPSCISSDSMWMPTTFSASLIHTPTMQELASVRRFLDGLCSGTNDDSASAAPLLRLIRRVDISPGSVSILLDRNTCAACLSIGARAHSRGCVRHGRRWPRPGRTV